MKSIRNGVINYVSFIKTYDMQAEAYNIKLEKVIGGTKYNFYGLLDISTVSQCNYFITLTIDLIDTDVAGGEYYLTISGAESDYAKYLCNVKDHVYVNSTNENSLLASTVKISNL
jgi:hypothetical protein